MTNLMKELEALYLSEQDLSLTGFSDKEIRTMLPGMMETEQDYVINGLEGVIPAQILVVGFDGNVGMPLPDLKGSIAEIINSHERILIPVSGDKCSTAALVWCKSNNIDFSKAVFVDLNFGQRMWRWHDDYLTYLEGHMEIEITRAPDLKDAWLADIKEQGYPSKEKLWCCNSYKKKVLSSFYTENPENTIIVMGAFNQEGVPPLRHVGKLVEENVHYAAPLLDLNEDGIVAYVGSAGIMLNPLYQITDKYFCPLCPQYSRPDYSFIKEHDLDLWVRWMVYFGRSQFCRDYVDLGKFATQAVDFIAESIDPRREGKYSQFALELPECRQPSRQEVREGDDYGWDKEADAQLSPETRLDAPRGKWWIEKGHSDFFTKQEAEMKKHHEDRGDMPLDEWMAIKIAEAKEAAKAEGWM